MAYGVGNVVQQKILTPQEHLANALELRSKQLEIDQQESETASKLKAEAENQRRQAWLQTAARTYKHDDGYPDWESIAGAASEVDPAFGLEMADRVGKMRSQAADLHTKELKNKVDSYGMVATLAEHVTDPDSYARFRQAAQAIDPELKDLPEQFDPNFLGQVKEQGYLNADYAKRHLELEKQASEGLISADKYLGGVLSLAQNQEDVDDAFRGAATRFRLTADQVRALKQDWGGQFGDGYAAHAGQRTMTPNERADNANAVKPPQNVFQSKEVMLNGKRAIVNFDPHTGTYADQNGQPITGVTPIPPVSASSGAATPMPANVAPQAQAVVARLITGLPGTQIGPIKQEVARLTQAGDEEGLKSYLRYAATRTVGEGRREVMRGRVETLTALNDAEALLKEVPTGYLKGTWEDVMRKLGTTSDPRLVDLGTRMGSVLANYVRSISGAAVTDLEAARLGRLLPNYKNGLPVNLGTIKGLSESIKSFDKGFYQNAFGNNYDWVMGTANPGSGADQPAASKTAVTVNQIVTIGNTKRKITKVYPDGSFDAEPVK